MPEFHTPGVYVQEIDSGAKPISSVGTSTAGLLGLLGIPRSVRLRIEEPRGYRWITLGEPAVGPGGRLVGDVEAITATCRALGVEDAGVENLRLFVESHEGVGRIELREEGDRLVLETYPPPRIPRGAAKAPLPDKGAGKGEEGAPAALAAPVSGRIALPSRHVTPQGRVLVGRRGAVAEMVSSVRRELRLPPQAFRPADLQALSGIYGLRIASTEEVEPKAEGHQVRPALVTSFGAFQRWLRAAFLEIQAEVYGQRYVLLPGDRVEEARLEADWRAFCGRPDVTRIALSARGFFENGGTRAWTSLRASRDPDAPLTGDAEGRSGLHAFDDIGEIALVAAPGAAPAGQEEVLAWCRSRGDCFGVLDGPAEPTPDMECPSEDRGFGAIYTPWLKVRNPFHDPAVAGSAPTVDVPPSGHVMGVYARVDADRGVHKAPGNELVLGVVGLTRDIGGREQESYNPRGINVIRDFAEYGRGIRIWGARTVATRSNASWRYVNVRRLFLMVEKSIELNTQWVVFEPNDPHLWKKLTRDVRAYLLRVWRDGALFGATADEAFYVKCDHETNTRETIDAGQVIIEVGLSPVKPAEFVVFRIGQWDGGARLTE